MYPKAADFFATKSHQNGSFLPADIVHAPMGAGWTSFALNIFVPFCGQHSA
jgi:hypothetical protein